MSDNGIPVNVRPEAWSIPAAWVTPSNDTVERMIFPRGEGTVEESLHDDPIPDAVVEG